MSLLQSQSYFTTGGLPPVSSSWLQAPWDSWHSNFIFELSTCGYSPYVTFSLTRRWACLLQLLMVLASVITLRWESLGNDDHILLFQIRDSPKLEGQVPVFISPRNRVARLYPQRLGSVFVAFYDSHGNGGGPSREHFPTLSLLSHAYPFLRERNGSARYNIIILLWKWRHPIPPKRR
jgi:hypothetical protein